MSGSESCSLSWHIQVVCQMNSIIHLTLCIPTLDEGTPETAQVVMKDVQQLLNQYCWECHCDLVCQ